MAVRSDAARLADTLRELIVEEGRTTRRHFDVVAEDLKDSIRIIAEGLGVHTRRLRITSTGCRGWSSRSSANPVPKPGLQTLERQ